MGYWNSENEQRLVELWNDGRSSQYIATLMGLTRSAVIGKVFRLRNAGMTLRADHEPIAGKAATTAFQHRKNRLYRKKKGLDPARVATMANARQRLLAKLLAESQAGLPSEAGAEKPLITSILELDHQHCRYPIGDPKKTDFGFCGKDRVFGLPYCPRHCLVAFTPADPARSAWPKVAGGVGMTAARSELETSEKLEVAPA